MKHYHIRPWELQEYTLVECSLMLLALREDDDDDNTIREDDSSEAVTIKQRRIQRVLEANHKYSKLTPQQKLNDAIREYRR